MGLEATQICSTSVCSWSHSLAIPLNQSSIFSLHTPGQPQKNCKTVSGRQHMPIRTFSEACFHLITLIYDILWLLGRAYLYMCLTTALVKTLITAVDPSTPSHLLGLKYLHHHSPLNQYMGAVTFSMSMEARQKFCTAWHLWQWTLSLENKDKKLFWK